MPSTILQTEHVFVCGGTGSGKSTVAEVYAAGFSETVIKVDPKHETEIRRSQGLPLWRGLVENEDFEVVESLEAVKKSKYKKIIWMPDASTTDMSTYNELCEYAYNEHNIRLWIDELMLFAEGPLKYPPFLRTIMVAGRVRQVTVIACTQRPTSIPAIVLANCQHFFVFNMNQDQDRKKMADATGCKKFLEPPLKHYFWYYKEGERPETARQYTLKM